MNKENEDSELEKLWQKTQTTPTEKLTADEAAVRIVVLSRAMVQIEDALDIGARIIQQQRAAAVAELMPVVRVALEIQEANISVGCTHPKQDMWARKLTKLDKAVEALPESIIKLAEVD